MQKVLSMNTYRASTFSYRAFLAFKRLFDIVFSLVAIIVLFPVLLAVSLIVAIDIKAFPIFVQLRMGRDNKRLKSLNSGPCLQALLRMLPQEA